MKLYKNKDGDITIIFNKNEKPKWVTIVHDRGKGKIRNIFGQEIGRYLFHCAGVDGNTPYSSTTDNSLIEKDDKHYKLVKCK